MYAWTDLDFLRFERAVDTMDFSGIDRDTAVANALCNAADVAESDDPVGCAISTVEMYIDQGVDTF